MLKTISCIIVDDEAIARDVIITHLSKIEHINIVAVCKNAMEAFNHISTQTIDLIFLDINMPDISGISFAKSINSNIKVIFTTAYRDYAIDGFELQAVDYLLKPISFERLLKAVNTYFNVYSRPVAAQELIASEAINFIFVRSDRKMIKVDYNDIVYIESYSDYIKIHLTEQIVVTRETISVIEAKLPKQKFMRIHRSYIIAINHISSFTNDHLTIKNKALPISRSYKKEVLQVLERYQ